MAFAISTELASSAAAAASNSACRPPQGRIRRGRGEIDVLTQERVEAGAQVGRLGRGGGRPRHRAGHRYLTRISPRMDWWRSQKYVYVPALEKVKLKVVPLPGSGVLNWPSRFSGVPEVTVCVMSSALAQVTRVPAFTSMGVGLN